MPGVVPWVDQMAGRKARCSADRKAVRQQEKLVVGLVQKEPTVAGIAGSGPLGAVVVAGRKKQAIQEPEAAHAAVERGSKQARESDPPSRQVVARSCSHRKRTGHVPRRDQCDRRDHLHACSDRHHDLNFASHDPHSFGVQC